MKCNGKTVQKMRQHLVPMIDIMSDRCIIGADDPIDEAEKDFVSKLDDVQREIEKAMKVLNEVGIVHVGRPGRQTECSTEGRTETQEALLAGLSSKKRKLFHKFTKLQKKEQQIIQSIESIRREKERAAAASGRKRIDDERYMVAKTACDFFSNVLFPSSFSESGTLDEIVAGIQEKIDAMLLAFKTAGYKAESKYYYNYVKNDIASIYGEMWHFFRLHPGALGTQTSEGFNKIIKNLFAKLCGINANGIGMTVRSIMLRLNVQLEFFFETVLAKGGDGQKTFRCSACGIAGHTARNSLCPKKSYKPASDCPQDDIDRRARLMTRYKVTSKLAGRLRFNYTEGRAVTQVSAIYQDEVDGDIFLNTGSNHISFSKYDSDLDGKTVKLVSMHIDEKYQRQRYGTIILAALHEEWFKMGFKEVIIVNPSSRGKPFYSQLGYEKNSTGDMVLRL